MEIKMLRRLFFIVVGFIISLTGFSYSWYNYTREGTNKEIIAGNIYLTMNEGEEQLNLSGVFPTTVSEARNKDNNFITFTLNGINESDRAIYYEIKLNYGDEKDEPYERFRDNELRFDLIEIDENGNELKYLLNSMTFDSIQNRRIWVDTVDANATTEVVKRYKLRAWLDENIIISDTESNATYPSTGAHAYKNHYASIKVSVFGDLNEKEVAYGFVNMKKAIASKTSCTPTTTATNNARIGGTGDVIYFTGAESCVDFNYVWYSGKLWRITAIYPDGTIKLITENNLTSILFGSNVTFDNSFVDQWLSQEFLPTLYNYQDIVVQNAEWNITTTDATTDPYLLTGSTTIKRTVGLLNTYEYTKAGSSKNYLNIGQTWWSMNPYDSSNMRFIGQEGNVSYQTISMYALGVRPSIYLKSSVSFTNISEANAGKRSNPYRISGDKTIGSNGELLNNRLSGEYVKLTDSNNNELLYRIIGIENGKIKIVSTSYVTNPNSSDSDKTLGYFGEDKFYNTSSSTNAYWDNYLTDTENGWVSTLSSTTRNMLDTGTYYLGVYPHGSNYKSTICATVSANTSTSACTKISDSTLLYTGIVGLLRAGELFSAQQSITTHINSSTSYKDMWLITPWSYNYERYVPTVGSCGYGVPSGRTYATRPTLYLKAGVTITGGSGKVNDPYTLTLSS